MRTAEARKLLGVDAAATPEAIKKAFRHLAMLWHPDRNPAPEAGEFFARLSTACEHLLESAARATAAAHASTRKTTSRGEDRHQDTELDIEHICLGGQAEVALKTSAECTVCSGEGFIASTSSQLCPHCQGSGRVRIGRELFRCEDCDGRGYTRRVRCPNCNGSGKQIDTRMLAVTVPPGVLPGDELRLLGEGFAPESGKGRPGDLHLRIKLRPHPLYTLEGSDLVLERPVSAFVLLGGGTVTVPSPGGLHHLELKPGPAVAREQVIAGAGVPARGTRAAGKLRVRLTPVLPSAPTPALIELYHALQTEVERVGHNSLPEIAAWEKRWLLGK
ncbi:MAG: DnaJ domain-containing protein [Azoarcus sp.]|nr:DnaJ domain-containing protein [Azoarcus sp.]